MKRLLLAVLAMGPLAVRAATLTAVSMQGGMLMPAVTYSNSDARVHVTMPVEVPILTPLLASNPEDNFDPADPWYDNLDPGRQGYAFSRRYGFNPGMVSDPLPANTVYSIRKLSGSPELGFYRYNQSAPKAWEPIFGTAGSPVSRIWNGIMFHPGVSAPAGTNTYSATFEVYLYDTNLNLEVANSSSGPLVFEFGNQPDGRPDLGLALTFAVSWPTSTVNWVVESAESLTATQWTVVTNLPFVVDGQSAVLLGVGEAGRCYRMRRAP
jgi:hypothetical protein